MSWDKQIPLTHALGWIVLSLFVVTGGGYYGVRRYQTHRSLPYYEAVISSVIQTGPQSRALPTDYFAELLGLSADRPTVVSRFSLKAAEQALLRSPLISRAQLRLLPPGTLYIDYTVRQPLAWFEDYDNLVVDKQGYPFPFSPFFSPKNLPSIYLGCGEFGVVSADPDQPQVTWGRPVGGARMALALSLLETVQSLAVCDQFIVRRIDVSNAFAPSSGMREIVIVTEDKFTQPVDGQDIEFIQPRQLRLSVNDFAQELGNYLVLRTQLLDQEQRSLAGMVMAPGSSRQVRLAEKILDFRVHQLAFIQTSSSGI